MKAFCRCGSPCQRPPQIIIMHVCLVPVFRRRLKKRCRENINRRERQKHFCFCVSSRHKAYANMTSLPRSADGAQSHTPYNTNSHVILTITMSKKISSRRLRMHKIKMSPRRNSNFFCAFVARTQHMQTSPRQVLRSLSFSIHRRLIN